MEHKISNPAECVLCGSKRQALVTNRNGFDIYRCDKCKLQYVYPFLTQSQVHAYYDTPTSREYRAASGQKPLKSEVDAPVSGCGYRPQGGRFRMSEQRVIARWILRQTGGGRLLEVGCGQGDLLAALEESGKFEVSGLDLDKSAIQYAASRGLDVAHGSLEEATYAPESFDVIVLWHVLEHVSDPIELLKLITSLLRPGGWFIGCFPTPEHLKARFNGPKWHYYCPPSHLWYFTKPSFRLICHLAGLDLVSASSFHWHAHMTVAAQKKRA